MFCIMTRLFVLIANTSLYFEFSKNSIGGMNRGGKEFAGTSFQFHYNEYLNIEKLH